MVLLTIGGVVVAFAEGESLAGMIFFVFALGVAGFIWYFGWENGPDVESPVVTSWRGRLVQRTSGPKAELWFGGRRVRVPHHWVDFIPGDVEFEGEAAVLPDQAHPILLKTSTGLSVEKEVGWGLLETFTARPQRWIGCLFGLGFFLMYLGIVGLGAYEGEPIRMLLLLRGTGIWGPVALSVIFLVGGTCLYYFAKHRWALWWIRENYWAEGVAGMPSREEFYAMKWRQVRRVLGMTVPGTALFLWAVRGMPVIGAVLGVFVGFFIGYFTRVVRPSR